MKITHIEKWKVVVPLKPDAVNSPEYDSKDESLSWFGNVPKHIIRIHTDDSGIVGIGETARGCPAEQVDSALAALSGREVESIDLHALPIARNAAYGAFEMALFDIVGKQLGVTAARLLGAQVRDRVLVDYWTGRRTPEDLARKAKEGQALGFGGIKIKCTLEDPNLERLQAIADAVGTNFKVTVDPNCRFYEPHHTLALADALGDLRHIVAVFEDPVPKHDLDWYVLLRQQLQVPVALHLYNGKDVFEAVKREAVDMLNISPGSMVGFVKMCYIAEQADVPVWHGSGVDLGIMDMSFVQACAAAPAATRPSDIVGNFVRQDDLIVDPIRIENGYALVPQQPGLGVELDEAAVSRYTSTEI
jgi:L-alanine-DL-glutamate epimerase-like enolase superfamily enzyme